MECIECVKKNEVPNCRQCKKEFVKRDIHFDIEEEEEQDLNFFRGVATLGIAIAVVAIIASLIYWWAGA